MSIRRSLYLRSCVHDWLAVRPAVASGFSLRFARPIRSRRYASVSTATTNALHLQEQGSASRNPFLSVEIHPEPEQNRDSTPDDDRSDGRSGTVADKSDPVDAPEKQRLTLQDVEEAFDIEKFAESDIDELLLQREAAANAAGGSAALLTPLLPHSVAGITDVKVRYKVHWDNLYAEMVAARAAGVFPDQNMFADERILAERFSSDLDPEQFRQKFHSLGFTSRLRLVPSLLIGSLVDSPERCLFMLENLLGYVRIRQRMQCLRHLHHAYGAEIQESPDLMRSYVAQLKSCGSPQTWELASMSPAFLKLLLRYLGPEQHESLVQDYKAIYAHAKTDELLVVVQYHISKGDVDEALRVFRKVPQELLQNPNQQIIDARNQLLMLDIVVKTETGSHFKILPELLAMGFKPDGDVHNHVLRRAISEGLSNVAWDLYNYMKQEGLEIDHLAYLDLLRDSFKSGHTRGVNDIMTAIYQDQSLVQSPYLVAYSMNIVRIVSYYHSESTPSEAFARIMALYDRVWSRKALQPFAILGRLHAIPDVERTAQPHPMNVAFTLWSYILVQRSERVSDTLWKRIVHLADQGDETTLEMLKYDVVYNAFILFHARKLTRLTNALQVLQYMMEKEICLPTARTWSMLTCAFLRHGQLDQAASTIRLMTAQGLTIESISGIHLPEGYSLEDLSRLVEIELDERQMPASLESLQSQVTSNTAGLEDRTAPAAA